VARCLPPLLAIVIHPPEPVRYTAAQRRTAPTAPASVAIGLWSVVVGRSAYQTLAVADGGAAWSIQNALRTFMPGELVPAMGWRCPGLTPSDGLACRISNCAPGACTPRSNRRAVR
jgi:hypothetical protein